MNDNWPVNLNRLNAVRLTDPGLYALGLHAFIENQAAQAVGSTRDMNFQDILQTWYRDHRDSIDSLGTGSAADFMAVLSAIIREHVITNTVRHSFASLSFEEARGITWNFLRLGDYTGWAALKEAGELRSSLETWELRESAAEDTELADLKTNFADLQSRSADIITQHPALDAKEKEILRLRKRLIDLEIASPDNGGQPTQEAGTSGETRFTSTRTEVLRSIRQLRAEIDSSDYHRYIDGLSRFSLTARTRRDYEKHLVRLTPEQYEALADFSTDTPEDMLITGSAGTGKTLVLLEALARTLKSRTPELHLGQPTKTTLVTFTRTLVKYDRYLAELMTPGTLQEADLESSETFFWKKLKEKEPKHTVDYQLIRNLMSEVNDSGLLSDAELWIEIEEFLFGLNISKDEYLDAAVPRNGLKTPLNLKEREQVWAIREKLAEYMEAEGRYSKHYARVRLLHWLESDPGALVTHENLFVDESQDMFAVELMCLKKLAGRSLIMAGDTGQSIYGFINPYRRANLELDQKQIRVLKTNHRNTIPIHNLAENYRRRGLRVGENPGPESYPFREGPDPEIHQMGNPDALADLLAAKARMYISDLGYDPEAVGILCSRTAHLVLIAEKLSAIGLASAVVKAGDFEFSRRGVLRLSTLHSSKGLDFPVVLMYLPEMPPVKEIDPPYQDRLYRNLQYVAMTRGMDVVEIFRSDSVGIVT